MRVSRSSFSLNEFRVPGLDGSGEPLRDCSASTADRRTHAYFRNLEDRLIDHISGTPAVLGCVAWMTSEPILEALAECDGVSINVQKEDFLRPDVSARPGWSRRLRDRYEALRPALRMTSDKAICGLYDRSREGLEDSPHLRRHLGAVRCVGCLDSNLVAPRSHHKFVVFCRPRQAPDENTWVDLGKWFDPYAVWTGSFNFTKNATQSFENAIYTEQPEIVAAYFHEWCQITVISEPCDWAWRWVSPEWSLDNK